MNDSCLLYVFAGYQIIFWNQLKLSEVLWNYSGIISGKIYSFIMFLTSIGQWRLVIGNNVLPPWKLLKSHGILPLGWTRHQKLVSTSLASYKRTRRRNGRTILTFKWKWEIDLLKISRHYRKQHFYIMKNLEDQNHEDVNVEKSGRPLTSVTDEKNQ